MPPVGFEPPISAGERPQTYALDRVATGTDTELPVFYPNKGNGIPGPVVNYLSLSDRKLDINNEPASMLFWNFKTHTLIKILY